MIKIEEGMVLLQNTCDEIKIGIRGELQRINEHIEHWLVKDIKTNSTTLYNLDTGRSMKVDNKTLYNMLKGNERLNIKPMFTISNERA